MIKKILLILFLIISLSTYSQNDSFPNYQALKKIFTKSYSKLENAINSKSASRLYNIQVWTNNLLEAAYHQKDYGIIDSLSKLYFEAYKQLQTPEYYYNNLGNELDSFKLNGKYKMWLEDGTFTEDSLTTEYKREILLNSTQFTYVLANTINIICRLPERTAYMDSMLHYYTPILIHDHYERWIFGKEGSFQMQGWNCIDGRYNHIEYLELKTKKYYGKPSYCRAILDQDMWIMAGVNELLAAHKIAPELIIMSDTLESQFVNYLKLSLDIVESRFSKTKLTDFNGEKTTGYAFDVKSFKDHEDNSYSNFKGECCPNDYDKKKVRKIGWDLSHMRRFVQIVSSIEQNKDLTGISFSDTLLIKKIANQFIYGVFNKDFEKPLFANYFDGQNGWYRVNYHGEGFGYAPYDLSDAAYTGGYLFWKKYNVDIEKLSKAMWAYFNSSNNELKEHKEEHYGRHYENSERTPIVNYNDESKFSNLLFWLMYLPVYF